MSKIFVDDAARKTMVDWVKHFEALIPIPHDKKVVSTRFGDNLVRSAGPKDGPPLVVLPGALTSSAHMLRELHPLAKAHRVHFVDVVGQSPDGAPARPAPDTREFTDWYLDILDELDLKSAALFGASWGGGIALNVAIHAPERIDKLVLMVPAAMAKASIWRGIMELGLPLMRYKLFPTQANLRTFAKPVLSTIDDEDGVRFMGDALRCFVIDMRLPSLVTKQQLAHFQQPVLVLAAEDDIHFPGPQVVARAKAVFPNLHDARIMPGTKHAPPTTDAFREDISEQIRAFLHG